MPVKRLSGSPAVPVAVPDRWLRLPPAERPITRETEISLETALRSGETQVGIPHTDRQRCYLLMCPRYSRSV